MNEFSVFMRQLGIEQQYSSPDTPQQNGCAERFNRTMVEKEEAMQHSACLPPNLWQFALEASVHVYNRQPFRRSNWKTPVELWKGKAPDVSYFHVFGCLAYVFIKKDQRSKLEPKSQPMIFLGYEFGSKVYSFLDEGRVIISANAVFDETVFPQCAKRIEVPHQNEVSREDHNEEDHESDMEVAPPVITSESNIPYSSTYDPPQSSVQDNAEPPVIPSGTRAHPTRIPLLVKGTVVTPKLSMEKVRFKPYPDPSIPRRSGHARVIPTRPDNVYGENVHPVEAEKLAEAESAAQEDPMTLGFGTHGESHDLVDLHRLHHEFSSDFLNFLMAKAEPLTPRIPVQYRDILRLPADEKKAWDSACQDEIDALWKRQVWTLTNLPRDRKPVKCHWVFSVKSDGSKRARLVAKGFSQEYGVDYEDVFSPIARFKSV